MEDSFKLKLHMLLCRIGTSIYTFKRRIKQFKVRVIYNTSSFRDVFNAGNITFIFNESFLHFLIIKGNSLKRSPRLLVMSI